MKKIVINSRICRWDEYVPICLKSVLNQTYENWIYIVLVSVNSESYIKDFLINELGEKVFQNKIMLRYFEDLKDRTERYQIFTQLGDYLFNIDGDDYLELDCLEKLVKALEETDSDIACCGVSTHNEDTGEIKNIRSVDETKVYKRTEYASEFTEYLKFYFPFWGKLYKSSLFEENIFSDVPPSNERGGYAGDTMMALAMLSKSNSFVIVSGNGCYYRKWEGSTTNKYIKNREKAMTIVYNFKKNFLSTLETSISKDNIDNLDVAYNSGVLAVLKLMDNSELKVNEKIEKFHYMLTNEIAIQTMALIGRRVLTGIKEYYDKYYRDYYNIGFKNNNIENMLNELDLILYKRKLETKNMIRISQIDENLSIYIDNTVILLGLGNGFKQMFDLLNYFRIKIDYICDNNKENWGKIRHDLKVISPPDLKKLIKNGNSNIIVQESIKYLDKQTIEKLHSIGVKSVISYNEGYKMLNLINLTKLYKFDPLNPIIENIISNDENNNDIKLINNILKSTDELPIFITQPMKTGDMTLNNTFKKYNVNHHFTGHNPTFLNKEILGDKKIKITTSVREPISQNISVLYQIIESPRTIFKNMEFIKKSDCYFQEGGDAQSWLDFTINSDLIKNRNYSISTFMDSFKKNILDLSKYEFDTEKGYSIIKEDNIEVFIYQLEKMNNVVVEMSNWIGQTQFDEWVVSNEASKKWIANSYRQAQKEIKFSKEYFDNCYDNPWIKHFYSSSDINKFKERWKSHIKN